MSRNLSVAMALLFAAACTTSPAPTATTGLPTPSPVPSPASSGPYVSPPPASAVPLEEIAARAAHTATTLPDGSVFVAGGCIIDGCGTATDATFILLPDGTTAIGGPLMAGPRDGHTATLTRDGNVVLAGGFSGEGAGALGSVELFDAAARAIRPLAALTVARGGQAAAALPSGEVLVAGGWVASRTYTSSVEILDPTSGSIRRAADLPVAADALDAVALADGRILVTGGQVRPAVATDQAEIYDPTTDTWTSLPPMSTPRLKHLSILLSDGRVLIIGGTPDDQHLLNSTEIFDPATNSFVVGPQLVEARYKMTGGAVALSSNRVLVGGGGRSVELIDVDAGTSSAVVSDSRRGSFATANAWGAAEFIVLGGYDDSIRLRRDYRIISLAELT